MAEIGIIIVTYNSEAEIGASLDAALQTGADVVVVDNGSQDRTIAEAARRGVRLIANSSNEGFAAAHKPGAPDSPFFWANLGSATTLPNPGQRSKDERESFGGLRAGSGAPGLISEQWPDTFIQLSDIPKA